MPATEGENEQAGGNRIKRPTMSNLFDLELSPNESDNVMRRHAGGFVDEQDSVRSGSQRRHRLPPVTLLLRLQRASRARARPRQAYARRPRILADRANIGALDSFERMLTRTLPSSSSSKKIATITP